MKSHLRTHRLLAQPFGITYPPRAVVSVGTASLEASGARSVFVGPVGAEEQAAVKATAARATTSRERRMIGGDRGREIEA